MLGSREESEDALQQVFASAYQSLLVGDGPDRLKPWLYAIARNRCLSMLQARRETIELDEVHEPSTDGLAIVDEIERRQDLKDLLGDLARLPDDQRAALVLSEIGDLSHDEIGVAMGVRTDKVKALVFQAREALMSSRRARETSCRDIQEQLATLRGGALRRSDLRRHIAACPECAAFKVEVKRQRTAMAALLPVLPGLALKHSVLTSAVTAGKGAAAGGMAAGVGVAGGSAASGLAGGIGTATVTAGSVGLAAKALAVVVVVGGASAGGIVAVQHQDRRADTPSPLSQPQRGGATPEVSTSVNTRTMLPVGTLAGRHRAVGRSTTRVQKHHSPHGVTRRRHVQGRPAPHAKDKQRTTVSQIKRNPSKRARRVLGAPGKAKHLPRPARAKHSPVAAKPKHAPPQSRAKPAAAGTPVDKTPRKPGV
jgi:RNA polymerase sigma factor (sigma-70 family)